MIKLADVTKIYGTEENGTKALDNVSLTINDGEMIAIMGTSGSGKSTLINLLGGMDTLTSGTYLYNGTDVGNMKLSELHKFRKNNISFVFQHFALMNHYTVFENVEVPLRAKRIKRARRKEIVMEKLKMLGIEELAKKLPVQISGGQQQRCAIARALAADNQLILADEPTGALDSKTGKEIMDIFTDIKHLGKTVIIVTHDNKIADRCERIVRIEDGKIVKDEKERE